MATLWIRLHVSMQLRTREAVTPHTDVTAYRRPIKSLQRNMLHTCESSPSRSHHDSYVVDTYTMQ